jgi:hypothetical protein
MCFGGRLAQKNQGYLVGNPKKGVGSGMIVFAKVHFLCKVEA